MFLQKPNLILNVDGFVAVSMVDFLRNCGLFTRSVMLLYFLSITKLFCPAASCCLAARFCKPSLHLAHQRVTHPNRARPPFVNGWPLCSHRGLHCPPYFSKVLCLVHTQWLMWGGALLLLLMACFREEATELIDNGVLNGMFVLGRSMGFIGKRNFIFSALMLWWISRHLNLRFDKTWHWYS